eukprot:scaffold5093_cov354-Chaetoceros_neogracile.AAC.1
MDEYNQKNYDEWCKVGPKHKNFLNWKMSYVQNSNCRCPTFLERMFLFLEMAKWSEIFRISYGFRLCFLGIKEDRLGVGNIFTRNDEWMGLVALYKHAMAYVGLLGIVFVPLCLYAVIAAPLGLLTGGYFWAREVKEYIFWGDMHAPKLSSDSKILKAEIDKLKDQIKEQIKELKDQNKEQMKQKLDAVAGEKAINAIDDNGRTALHWACVNGASWEVINGLLGKLHEKVINAINERGESALHVACFHKASSEVINALLGKLDEKAINAIDIIGNTALHVACYNGASSSAVISGLLDKLNEKAINAINDNGDNALLYAWKNAISYEVISAILTHYHGKRILEMHSIMEDNDPTASSYPNGLLVIILNLPSEDRDESEVMNHSYFRKGINAKIIQPFSLSILFLDVAVQGLVMAVFSFTINGAVKELPSTSTGGLISCLLWLLFRELVQYSSATAKFYFDDAAKFVDIIQIGLIIPVLLISFKVIGKGSIDEGLLVACIG